MYIDCCVLKRLHMIYILITCSLKTTPNCAHQVYAQNHINSNEKDHKHITIVTLIIATHRYVCLVHTSPVIPAMSISRLYRCSIWTISRSYINSHCTLAWCLSLPLISLSITNRIIKVCEYIVTCKLPHSCTHGLNGLDIDLIRLRP